MTMKDRVKTLLDEAARLSVEERIELIERLQASLGAGDPAIERDWMEECESRLEAYRAGEIECRDADEVLAKYLKP